MHTIYERRDPGGCDLDYFVGDLDDIGFLTGPPKMAFDDRPQPLKRVQGAAVGDQEEELEVAAPLAIHYLDISGSKVVHDYQAAPVGYDISDSMHARNRRKSLGILSP